MTVVRAAESDADLEAWRQVRLLKHASLAWAESSGLCEVYTWTQSSGTTACER